MRRTVAVTCMLLSLTLSLGTNACDAQSDLCSPHRTIARQGEKAQCVKARLSNWRYALRKTHLTPQGEVFCGQFYRALQQANDGIEYIEPILWTDDPQDPRLLAYNACSESDHQEDAAPYAGIYAHAHNLRLYRWEMNHNDLDGQEEYVYEEETTPIEGMLQTRYVRIDLSSCKELDGVVASPEYPRKTPAPWGTGINAFIHYQGNYYIVDMNGKESIGLYKYLKKERRFDTKSTCSWRGLE